MFKPRGFPLAEGNPSLVSIVIPARNEEKTLPKLLQSLKLSQVESEIIVVDDHSTDQTAALALRLGARVITSEPLPAGWTGKNWSCAQGARYAKNNTLLFLDADTVMSPGALNHILNYFETQRDTALSLFPYQLTETWHEQLSAFFLLVMAMSTGAFGLLKNPSTVLLVGQSLVIRKTDYLKGGGHESVKSKILENLYFTRKLRQAGVKTQTWLGKNVLSVRMFSDGLGQLLESWSKAFQTGPQEVPPVSMIAIVLWLSTLSSTLTLVILDPWLGILTYGIFFIQIYFMLRAIGRFSLATSIFFPIPLLFYFFIFFRSLVRGRQHRSIQWRGRELPPSGEDT